MSEVVLDIEVRRPKGYLRWRWFLCYLLLKLAAKVYPFKLALYREREPWD